MAELKLLADSSLATIIDDNATLNDAVRAAGDYANDTELDLFGMFFLTLQWNSTPPTTLDKIADLYILPGDGEGTEVFPEGGDAGLGTNDTPQSIFLVHSFQTINPSITVDEVLASPAIPLYPDGNRVVLLNTSGQQFDLTWILKMKPVKAQVV